MHTFTMSIILSKENTRALVYVDNQRRLNTSTSSCYQLLTLVSRGVKSHRGEDTRSDRRQVTGEMRRQERQMRGAEKIGESGDRRERREVTERRDDRREEMIGEKRGQERQKTGEAK
jgi:hypothetical protein